MNPSVPLSPHAQPSHGIELFSLYVYLAGVCFLPHSPQERRGVRKVKNSRVAFRRSLRFGASQLCGSTWLVSSCGVQRKWISGQESKGVIRVRASGMLIPTAGLLLLRQAPMDVVVRLSRAHAAATAARRACAGRVHAVR
jgi:hypothetical protein